MKKLLAFIALSLFLFSCAGRKEKVELIDSSDILYVRKIENIPDDFIFAMDTSQVISLEDSGVKYYDFNRSEEDVFKILASCGFTHIRVRVWNDPFDANGNGYGGGNCNIDTAVKIGKRASKYGLKLIVDFHYSDFWADPSKQMCPKAWKDMDIDTKANALYEYTKECLNKLKKEKIDVDIVTLGNETNGAMAGETNWYNIVFMLMNAGSKASREVFPKARIAVHFANPENSDSYMTYAKKLDYYNLDYDIFTSSYYPYWHGTLENLKNTLSKIAETYDKKVMVMETSYAYTTDDSDFSANTISSESSITKNYPFSVQGQTNCLLDIVETIVNTTNGIGVCYWEGTWIGVGINSYEENSLLWEKYGSGWASSYAAKYDPKDAGKYYGGDAVDNQALFDKYGMPLESLKTFALCRNGNITDTHIESIADCYVTCDLNGEIVLPEKVDAIMTDGSKKQIDVKWADINEEEIRSNGPKVYDIVGIADNDKLAICHVSMIEFNYLNNNSFELDENKTNIPSYWTVTDNKKADELYVEDKITDSLIGNKHFHFWSSAVNSVDFDLKQNVQGLEQGKYKYTISIMGGDCGTTNIYSYVKINEKIVKQTPLQITSYNNWDTQTINDIEYNGKDEITFGIHVEAQGQGNGAWGKIDEALLNRES